MFHTNLIFDDHLELDIEKYCSINRNTHQKQNYQISCNISKHIDNKTVKNKNQTVIQDSLQNNPKNKVLKKQVKLNRMSRCFEQEIKKVLKKSKTKIEKLKNSKQSIFIRNISPQLFLNFKQTKKNQQQNLQIKQKNDQHYNLSKNLDQSQLFLSSFKVQKKVNNQDQNIKSKRDKIQHSIRKKKKSNDHLKQKQKSKILKDQNINKYQKQLNQKLDQCVVSKNQFFNSPVSRKIKSVQKNKKSLNQTKIYFQNNYKSRNKQQQIQKDNKRPNKKLRWSLDESNRKQDSLNDQFKYVTIQDKNNIIPEHQDQISKKNYAQFTQQIHFGKLRQKVFSQMQKYNKLNLINKTQEKQLKIFKKTFNTNEKRRIYHYNIASKEEHLIQVQSLNIQGFNELNNENSLVRQFKHRRTYTASSRTGLQFKKDTYRRRWYINESNPRQRPLTGVKSSSNQFLTFNHKSKLNDIDISEQKSDRVIKQLRKTFGYSKSTPRNSSTIKSNRKSTCHPVSNSLTERVQHNNSTNNRNSDCLKFDSSAKDTQTSTPNHYLQEQFKKSTIKDIQKQQIKQKVFQLMINCQQQQSHNKRIKKGIQIFEHYCDNIDQGLKDISSTIGKYLSKIE